MSTEDQTADEIAASAIARMFPWTIDLKHPIDLGSERITSLTVRRGKLGDLKGIKIGGDAMPADHLMLVASRMTGQNIRVIESLDPEDAEEVMSLVLDFFAKCLGGGRTR